ncbi:MAG: DUF4097 family beta strand repeat-containing protein [Ruthenibacterium sp.]
MKNFLKFLLGLAGFACVVGIAVLIVGFCMGGKPTNIGMRWNGGRPQLVHSDFHDNAPSQDHANESAGRNQNAILGPVVSAATNGDVTKIRGLSLDIDAAAVTISRGATYTLAVSDNTSYSDHIDEDGIWEIESENNFSSGLNADSVFHITVPDDVVLDELELSLDAGNLTADNLACKKADLEVGGGTMTLTDFSCTDGAQLKVDAGSIDADGALSGKTRIDCALGKVTLKTTQPADYGYDIECGVGSVHIGDSHYSGLAKEVERNKNAKDFYKIDCGMGQVKISFE